MTPSRDRDGITEEKKPEDASVSQTPESVLLADVAVPAFFEKLAVETGFSPSDAETSASLIGTGNLITNAIDLYIQKRANAATFASHSAVKAATDAAFETAGVLAAAQPPATSPMQYLGSSAVRDAALLVVANAVKQAGTAPVMDPKKTEEEEEDAKVKVVVPKV